MAEFLINLISPLMLHLLLPLLEILLQCLFILVILHIAQTLISKSDILIIRKLITTINYNFIMSSLTSLFEKRAKHTQQSALTSLFAKEQSKKFENLAEEANPSHVVYLKPEPKKEQPEDLQATIFVGNVPVSYTHKSLKKLFASYGKIQKVWFRSAPVEQNKLGKKSNFILKKFQQDGDSMNGYVKFTDKQFAEKACAANGTVVEQHTLRVSMCLDDNLDYESTLFVGNLPFDIKQEELRRHFGGNGQITNVRVVKDKYTLKGIGIGYVKYANKQDMFKALHSMNGSILKQRELRVKRAVEKSRLQKKIRNVMEKKLHKKGYTPPEQVKKMMQKQAFERDNSNNAQLTPTQQSKQNARKFHFKRKMIKK